MNEIQALIDHFEPISLPEMESVALLNRIDTKYLMNVDQFGQILAQIRHRYRVLTVDEVRLNHYQTLYFDTADFALYLRHHNGGLNRYKVRCRKYVDSNLCYLEVKFKTNKGRTIKNRIRIPEIITKFEEYTHDFLREYCPLDLHLLEPKIWNSFVRITMVSKYAVERLTIDLNLQYQHGKDELELPGLVVTEVKQEGFSLKSDFIQQIRTMNLQPIGFSKYCMGAAKMYQHLKSNNFKPSNLLIKKLT